MNKLMYANQFIRTAFHGEAIFAEIARPEPKIDFLIREESSIIMAIPQQPSISLRGAFINSNSVGVIVLMFQVGGNIYETWFNYHAQGVASAIEQFIGQDDLGLHFCGDSLDFERHIMIYHVDKKTKTFFEKVSGHIESHLQPWTMQQFDIEKMRICGRFHSSKSLWDIAGNQNN